MFHSVQPAPITDEPTPYPTPEPSPAPVTVSWLRTLICSKVYRLHENQSYLVIIHFVQPAPIETPDPTPDPTPQPVTVSLSRSICLSFRRVMN